MDSRVDENVIRVDNDLKVCPLSRIPFRHPVLGSDGYHYEAACLAVYIRKFGLVSPMRERLPLTHFTYDLQVKNSLDLNKNLDRYDEYNPTNDLAYLNSQFGQAKVNFQPIFLVHSIKAGWAIGYLFFLYQNVVASSANSICKEQNVSLSLSVNMGLIYGISDFVFRCHHQNNLGLFAAGVQSVANCATTGIEYVRRFFRL